MTTVRPDKNQYWQSGDYIGTEDLTEIYLIVYDDERDLYLFVNENGSISMKANTSLLVFAKDNPKYIPLRHAELIVG